MSRIVRHHMRPLQLQRATPLSPRSLHRYHRATGDVAPEVCLLSLADNLAKGAERAHGAWPDFVARVAELLDAFFFHHDEVVAPPPLLRGGDLVTRARHPAGAVDRRAAARPRRGAGGRRGAHREEAATLAHALVARSMARRRACDRAALTRCSSTAPRTRH